MIRKMTENDRKLYIEMAEEFYSSDAVLHPVPREYFEKTADEALRSDVYAEIFILDCEGIPAGYGLTARTFSQEAGGQVLWIEELYIREEFRSRGLGREFFSYIEEKTAGRPQDSVLKWKKIIQEPYLCTKDWDMRCLTINRW